MDGACLRGFTAHTPGKRWHLPTPFSSIERDFLTARNKFGKLLGVSPVTHTQRFYDELFLEYHAIQQEGDPIKVERWVNQIKNDHGVIVALALKSIMPLDMRSWHLDRFHAITTPARNGFIAGLVKTLIHRGSFDTVKIFFKRIRVAKVCLCVVCCDVCTITLHLCAQGGGLWLRVRTYTGRDPGIVGDAGDAMSFSTTDPEEILGPFYHHPKHGRTKLEQWAREAKIPFTSNTTSRELQDKLNKILAEKQGWTASDRICLSCILHTWHYICTFVMLGPGLQQFR